MRAPVLAGRAGLTIATLGGGLLAQTGALGTDGYFMRVAMGLTACGLTTASGVRPAVWRISRPKACCSNLHQRVTRNLSQDRTIPA